MEKKKILMLLTGGTVVSGSSDKGMMPLQTWRSLTDQIPEIMEQCDITFKEICLLDSANIQPEHWVEMAKEVYASHDDYDGIVVLHGTDTMAYSASAVTVMVKNIKIPVIFTGSMLTLEEAGSDVKSNLKDACLTAMSGVPGVYIVFAGRILNARVAHKVHSMEMDAFRSINSQDAGYIRNGKIHWERLPEMPKDDLKIKIKLDQRVVVVQLVPGTTTEVLNTLMNAGFKGIILRAYGCGGIPTKGPVGRKLIPCLIKAKEMHVAVVITSQCMYDGVDMDKYEVNRKAVEYGAISAHNMTTELATVKLMWELAHYHNDLELVRECFNQL